MDQSDDIKIYSLLLRLEVEVFVILIIFTEWCQTPHQSSLSPRNIVDNPCICKALYGWKPTKITKPTCIIVLFSLKYICIDLSQSSRLGCPCLRLTDDDDDSRPAQMIPIALMIPARVWSTFDKIFLFLFAAGEGQKEILAHARAYQIWSSGSF